MANFNIVCPKSYPNKCNLVLSERAQLEKKEKFKLFFMHQFEGNDTYLEETINEYFRYPEYYVFNARCEPGLGVKICKICQLALACDFGAACISPENYNVFLEIGMLFTLGKPCIMIYNKEKLNHKDPSKVPFDISAFTNIPFSSRKTLLDGLKREIPSFIRKLRTFSDAQKDFTDTVVGRLKVLPKESLLILKEFVKEGKRGFNVSDFLKWEKEKIQAFGWNYDMVTSSTHKLIGSFIMEHGTGSGIRVSLEEGCREFLEQYLWSSEFEELVAMK